MEQKENDLPVRAEAIKKNFRRASKSSNFFTAVDTLDFSLEKAKLTEITGRSGSGKSTLLNMLAGLLPPSEGKVFVDGRDLYALKEDERSRLRNEKIGLIPQGHTALLSLTVLENVLLPFILYKKDPPPEERAKELLELVGLTELADSKPDELSGGELRRLSLARAMLMSPAILLADEPTAGLDNENTRQVLSLLKESAQQGTAVLIVTHEEDAKDYTDQLYVMDGGKLTREK